MDLGKLFDEMGFVLLYLAIAIVAAIIVIGLLVYFFKRDRFKDFLKYCVGIVLGISVVALVLMTYLKAKCNELDETPMSKMLFVPILVELCLALAGGIAVLISSVFSKKAAKISGLVTAVALLGGFIAIMVETSKYYETVKGDYNANLTGLIVSAVVFMALTVVFYFLGDKRKISDTRSIVFGGIAIATSFALSYIKFYEMPQGGSLTLASLLPLMIYCCMFGTRRGVIVALLYGTLQAIQDPWIIHPMQFLLDYPLAFGMIGISGIFVEKNVFRFKGNKQRLNKLLGFLAGGIVAVIGRYACHVMSGLFAFADMTNGWGPAIVYSLGYNAFAFADMAIALVAGSFLFLSTSFTSQMEKSGEDFVRSEANVNENSEGDVVHNDVDVNECAENVDSNENITHDEDDDFVPEIFDRSEAEVKENTEDKDNSDDNSEE